MHPKECECVDCLCATSQKIYEETVGKLDQILNNTKTHEKYKYEQTYQKPTENIQKFLNDQIYYDIKTKLNNIQTLINNDNYQINIKHKKRQKPEQNKVKLPIKQPQLEELNKLDQLTPPLRDLLILTAQHLSTMCNCNNCKCKICTCKPDTILTNTDLQVAEDLPIKEDNIPPPENPSTTITTNLGSEISNTSSVKKLTKRNCKCKKRQQISTNTDFKQSEKGCSYHRLYDNDIGVKTSFESKTSLMQLREKIDLCKTQLSIMNAISKDSPTTPINSSSSTINNNNNPIRSIVTLKNKLEELNALCIKARESNNLCKRLSQLSSTSERFAYDDNNMKKVSVIKELEDAKLAAKNAPSTVSFPSVDISDSYFRSKKMGENININENLPKIPYFRAVDNVYTSTPNYRYICRGGRISSGIIHV